MAVLIGDSCCRGMRVTGVVVQAVGGLLASNSLDPEGPCSSVILAVGGNDLANGCSPAQVIACLQAAVEKVQIVLLYIDI